ncbi:MAG: hypothetical protein Q4B31_02890 [Clostridia bacterium]|nr:hypothetical protein [Clostridia bacterium]
MADGTLIFDTELDANGLNKGLEALSKSSGESAKKVSDSILKNITKPIKETAEAMSDATEQMVTDAVSADKRISESRLATLEHYLECEIKNFEKTKELRSEELSAIEKSYELGIISTDQYFKSLADYRDKYFESGSSGWLSYVTGVISENKRLTDEQKRALTNVCEDMSDNIKDMFQSIAKEREKLEEKLNSYGSLTGKKIFDFGDGKREEFLTLADTEAQNERLEDYLHFMMSAQKRINEYWRTDTGDRALDEKNLKLRNEYFSQMRDMSIDEATDFASLLTNVKDTEFNAHLASFERRQYLSEEISNLLFCEETKSAAQNAAINLGKDFSDALLDEMESVDGELYMRGQSAAESFGSGFMESFRAILMSLSEEIANGTSIVSHDSLMGIVGGNIENNTSYNIYPADSASDTIRAIKEYEEVKRLFE